VSARKGTPLAVRRAIDGAPSPGPFVWFGLATFPEAEEVFRAIGRAALTARKASAQRDDEPAKIADVLDALAWALNVQGAKATADLAHVSRRVLKRGVPLPAKEVLRQVGRRVLVNAYGNAVNGADDEIAEAFGRDAFESRASTFSSKPAAIEYVILLLDMTLRQSRSDVEGSILRIEACREEAAGAVDGLARNLRRQETLLGVRLGAAARTSLVVEVASRMERGQWEAEQIFWHAIRLTPASEKHVTRLKSGYEQRMTRAMLRGLAGGTPE
jgi:hypothetical protein